MEDLTSFSLRIPKSLARSIETEAKRSGMNKSEYARGARSMTSINVSCRSALLKISRRLAYHSAAADQSMEASTSDGLP